MKRVFKYLYCFFVFGIATVMGLTCYYNYILPDKVMIYDNERIIFNTKFDIEETKNKNINTVSNNVKSISNSYQSDLKLMGIIPIKSITVNKVNERYVALSGESFGIKIFTKGVMVVGLSDVNSNVGNVNPAKQAGLKIGDIILTANGKSISSNEQLSQLIKANKGNYLEFKIKRDDEVSVIKFKPLYCNDSKTYKAGIWVRDSTAGLGTMTFYSTVDGSFAGLGHGVMDVDTGILLPINSGEIVKTKIISVTKGKKGTAGEICGAFTGETQGKLITNCKCGLYGFLDEYKSNKKLVKVALNQEVKTGKARILTTINNGKPKYYSCVIERIDYNDTDQKNLMIKITDEELIDKTGGIIQGMSGSPIVQNGQLVGALTNVFVNDPEKGYAVFAEEMYDQLIDNVRQYSKVS